MSDVARAGGWAEAMAAFETWADLPEGERAGWLDGLAATNAELHARVASLIRSDQEAQSRSFLSPGANATPAPVAASATPSLNASSAHGKPAASSRPLPTPSSQRRTLFGDRK